MTKEGFELIVGPHVSLDFEEVFFSNFGAHVVFENVKFYVFFIDSSVRQIRKLIMNLIRIIILAGKSEVIFIVKPYF